ncbi:hypothetical protein [Spiroplasma endosymbiont of Colias croceus]|uniref:hypothetical protein n=1 Tax=Spiroplasma endosymbiont of Colias croceus TaxID=3066310 RepID=UPI0030D25B5F
MNKEKLINYLENEFNKELKNDISDKNEIDISNNNCNLIFISQLQEKIKKGEFDE